MKLEIISEFYTVIIHLQTSEQYPLPINTSLNCCPESALNGRSYIPTRDKKVHTMSKWGEIQF